MAKVGIWVFWIAALLAIAFGSGWVATLGFWAFWLTLGAHLVEFLLNRKLFERAEGSLGHHFVQTMIYGLFHWKPIQERLEGEAPG